MALGMAAIDSWLFSISWESGVLRARESDIATQRMTSITKESISTGMLEACLEMTDGTFFSDAQWKEKCLLLHEAPWGVLWIQVHKPWTCTSMAESHLYFLR
jgi:hypothetical protein